VFNDLNAPLVPYQSGFDRLCEAHIGALRYIKITVKGY
jgi:hypothetical protein